MIKHPIQSVGEPVGTKLNSEEIIRLQSSIGSQELYLRSENADRLDEENEFKRELRTLNKPTTDAVNKLAKDYVEEKRKKQNAKEEISTESGTSMSSNINTMDRDAEIRYGADGFLRINGVVHVYFNDTIYEIPFQEGPPDERLLMMQNEVTFNGYQIKYFEENLIIENDNKIQLSIPLSIPLLKLLCFSFQTYKPFPDNLTEYDFINFLRLCKFTNRSRRDFLKLKRIIGENSLEKFKKLDGDNEIKNFASKLDLNEILNSMKKPVTPRREESISTDNGASPEASSPDILDKIEGSGLKFDMKKLTQQGILEIKNGKGLKVFKRKKPSPGLISLLLKIPDVSHTKNDLKSYKYFEKVLDRYTNHNGKSLPKEPIIVESYEELLDRLTILLGEYSAGNHETYNTIISILDTLLKGNKISKEEYTILRPKL